LIKNKWYRRLIWNDNRDILNDKKRNNKIVRRLTVSLIVSVNTFILTFAMTLYIAVIVSSRMKHALLEQRSGISLNYLLFAISQAFLMNLLVFENSIFSLLCSFGSTILILDKTSHFYKNEQASVNIKNLI
jgi:hypothetical protein